MPISEPSDRFFLSTPYTHEIYLLSYTSNMYNVRESIFFFASLLNGVNSYKKEFASLGENSFLEKWIPSLKSFVTKKCIQKVTNVVSL